MALNRRLSILRMLRRNRLRSDLIRFEGDIAAPQGLGNVAQSGASSAYTMPANGRLGISLNNGLSANDITIDVGPNRLFATPALAADQIYRGEWAEKGWAVVINRGATAPSGTAVLYVIDGFGVGWPIATATFTV